MEKNEAAYQKEQKETIESAILQGEEASLWLRERGLFNADTQSPPLKIFTIRITGEIASTLSSVGKTVSLSALKKYITIEDAIFQEFPSDCSDTIGIKVSGEDEAGANYIEIVWALEY